MLLRLKWREGQWPRRPLHSSCSWGQNVQSQLLLVPCCPHCLNSLTSPDWDPISKASLEGLMPATHQHCLGRQSRMYTTYREAGELPCYHPRLPSTSVQMNRCSACILAKQLQSLFWPEAEALLTNHNTNSPLRPQRPLWRTTRITETSNSSSPYRDWILRMLIYSFCTLEHHIWLIQKARWFGRSLGVALQSRGCRLCLSNLIWASLIFYSL